MAQESQARAETFVRRAIAENRDPKAAERRPLEAQLAQARTASDHRREAELTGTLSALRERHYEQLRPRLVNPEMRSANPFELPVEGDVQCWPQVSTNTSWGLMLEDAQVLPETDNWMDLWKVSGRVAIAHVDREGTVTTAPIVNVISPADVQVPTGFTSRFAHANCCAYDGMEAMTAQPFDFDGDGEPELLIHTSFFLEGDFSEWTELYQYARGSIQPYARPAGFAMTAIQDVDGDHRPDLLSSPRITGGESCGSGFAITGNPPALVAISLPNGTFDPAGAGAKAHARTWCPSNPRRLTELSHVVCARLWGRTVQNIRAEILRTQRPWNCADENAQRRQRDRRANREYELLLAGLALPVFFSLATPAP